MTMFLVIFHELSGYNAIMMYSNTILTDMFGDNTSGLTARTGTTLIGFTAMLASILAIVILNKFKRRQLIVPG